MNRRVATLLVVALAALGVFAVPAMADAPDPIPAATDGTLVTNPDGSRTLTVWGGTNANSNPGWQWTTHGSDCNNDRAGAGFAIVWNDPNDHSNPLVGKVNGANMTFFVGTASDNVVHATPQLIAGRAAADDSKVTDPSLYQLWRGGCGVYLPHTNAVLPDGSVKSGSWNQGTWGPISHTYAASVKGPISVCPIMYDVHGPDSGQQPNGEKEITAGGSGLNGDNSVQSNGSTPLGNGCFTKQFGTPHLTLTKEVSSDGGQTWHKSVSVHAGAAVQYRFTAKNDGELNLTGVHINELTGIADCSVHATSPAGFNGDLAVGQTAVFTCSHTMGSSDLTNVANASGTDSSNQGVQSNNDQADVHVLHPGIDVSKQAAEKVVLVGEVIHYTVTVKNTGDAALTVTPSDTGCDGFNSGTFVLQAGASQTLNCSHTATAADGSAYVNRACATGSDSGGGSVSDCDSVTTPVQHPAISIDKSGPATANAGDKVQYTLIVTDPGDTSFAESNVRVGDPRCDGDSVKLVGKSGDASPGTLDPGDVWTYTCSAQSSTNDTSIHNVATVVGTDVAGHTVNDTDDADTTLTSPGQAVLGERAAPGAAKLFAPTGCTPRPFTARVRGSKIASAVFVLDGKVVKRVKNAKNPALVQYRVKPNKLRLGVHRLVVTVTFRSGSGTKPKTLRLSFQRCGKKLAQPRFTG